MAQQEQEFLAAAGQLVWMRDRLESLGLQLASGTGLQGGPAREIAKLVNSGQLDRAEQAQAALAGGAQ